VAFQEYLVRKPLALAELGSNHWLLIKRRCAIQALSQSQVLARRPYHDLLRHCCQNNADDIALSARTNVADVAELSRAERDLDWIENINDARLLVRFGSRRLLRSSV